MMKSKTGTPKRIGTGLAAVKHPETYECIIDEMLSMH